MLVREAHPEDYPAYAELFLELETGDPIPSRDSYLTRVQATSLVAADGDRVVGWIYFQPFEDLGKVTHLMVAPDARRRGLARQLMLRAAQELRLRGLRHWALNVKPDNEPALRLYRGLGMVEKYRSASVRLAWSCAESLPGPTEDLRVSEVGREHAAELEATWKLPAGQLSQSWASDVRVFAASLASSEALASEGFARFVPSFPGAYPFRARDAAAVRCLVEAMHRYRDDSFDFVRLTCEDAPLLVDALLAAGAEIHLEIMHLEGAIPEA